LHAAADGTGCIRPETIAFFIIRTKSLDLPKTNGSFNFNGSNFLNFTDPDYGYGNFSLLSSSDLSYLNGNYSYNNETELEEEIITGNKSNLIVPN